MKVLYKDDSRKQFLSYDTMDDEFKEVLQKFFNKRKKQYMEREIGWSEWFDNMMKPPTYNPYRMAETYTYKEHVKGVKYDVPLDIIISKSLDIIHTIDGVTIKGDLVKFRYFEIKMDNSDEPYDYDKQHYYQFNELDNENMYGVMYCIKKDSTIKDGNLTIYPHWEDDTTISNLFGLFGNVRNIEIPTEENSIIVMNGTTFFNVPKISGTGTMQILYVIFYNNNK
jgi:hypothetical protein